MSGSFGYLHLGAALVVGAIIGAVLVLIMPSFAGSYDECMLKEMKGQPQTSFQSAHRVCDRRYPDNPFHEMLKR